MGLAALLIPLLPSLLTGVMDIVGAIREHPDTPDELKMQLDGIATDLQAVNSRVQAVVLPP